MLGSSDKTQFPESLNGTLNTTLEQYNNVLISNNQLREELKTMKALVRKSDHSKNDYKNHYEKLKQMYKKLQQDIEQDVEQTKLKGENEHMKTSLETMEAAWKADQQTILQLRDKIKEDSSKSKDAQTQPTTQLSNNTNEEDKSVIEQLKTSLETIEAAWKVDQEILQMLQNKMKENSSKPKETQIQPTTGNRAVEPDTLDHQNPGQSSIPSISINPISKTVTNNIFVTGESQARGLREILSAKLSPNKSCIKSAFKPGAKIKDTVESINPDQIEQNSKVIFFAGTNDLFQTLANDIKLELDKLYEKLKKFDVLIIFVPPRFEIRKANFHIKKLNCLIKYHVSQFENFQYIDPCNFLKFSHLTRDYVHLDQKGKELLCNRIISKLKLTNISIGTTDHQSGKPSNKVISNRDRDTTYSHRYTNKQHTGYSNRRYTNTPARTYHTPGIPLIQNRYVLNSNYDSDSHFD